MLVLGIISLTLHQSLLVLFGYLLICKERKKEKMKERKKKAITTERVNVELIDHRRISIITNPSSTSCTNSNNVLSSHNESMEIEIESPNSISLSSRESLVHIIQFTDVISLFLYLLKYIW